jgi:hypothetical protein
MVAWKICGAEPLFEDPVPNFWDQQLQASSDCEAEKPLSDANFELASVFWQATRIVSPSPLPLSLGPTSCLHFYLSGSHCNLQALKFQPRDIFIAPK